MESGKGAVLVTGAGGFVGSAVVRLLVKSLRNASLRFWDGSPVKHVVALLRPGGSTERLEELPRSNDWSIEYADMADRKQLGGLLNRARPKAVLHVAAAREIFGDLTEAERNQVNVTPLEILFEGLVGVPGARLIHTSSAWVLPAGERLDEGSELEPLSAYAENKAQLDKLLPILHKRTGVNWINLRLFNMFGKYENESRLLPYLVSRLTMSKVANLSSGDQIRDFSDVEDVARSYLLALQADESICGNVYHIGSGRGITLRDFSSAVADVTGNSHLIHYDTIETRDQYLPCQVADPTRAGRFLHWFPAGDLEDRIRETVRWWLRRWRAVTRSGGERRATAL
jgi:nucleoside-diphosphate-sugar epimerase